MRVVHGCCHISTFIHSTSHSVKEEDILSKENMTMLHPKKLIKMVKKWQRMAALGRRRIAMTIRDAGLDGDESSTASVADKGHCVVYSIDGQRFMVPLAYLSSRILRELFKMSEEEFGLSCDGPITLPCDAAFMEYVMSLLGKGVPEEVERMIVSSLLVPRHCACSIPLAEFNQQLAVCSF